MHPRVKLLFIMAVILCLFALSIPLVVLFFPEHSEEAVSKVCSFEYSVGFWEVDSMLIKMDETEYLKWCINER